MKFFVNFAMPGIETAIAEHFEVLFRDMANQPFDEINSREGFFYVFIILMTIVMEGNGMSIVVIDSGSRNNGTSKITTDVFHNSGRVAKIWLRINIKPLFMFTVTKGFDFFEVKNTLRQNPSSLAPGIFYCNSSKIRKTIFL